MKRSIVIVAIWTMVLLPALTGAATLGAVEYKSTYRGVQVKPVYGIATTATTPNAAFRSTSAYSTQWNDEPSSSLLNSDGSVNSGAYMTSGPNRAKKDEVLPPNPEVDDDDSGNVPLGDGLLLLLALAIVYALARRKTRIQEP